MMATCGCGRQSGKPLRTFTVKPGSDLRNCDLSPDGRTLAVLGGRPGGVALWDVAGGRKVAAWESKGSPNADGVRFSPDGRVLAVTAFKPAEDWPHSTRRHPPTPGGRDGQGPAQLRRRQGDERPLPPVLPRRHVPDRLPPPILRDLGPHHGETGAPPTSPAGPCSSCPTTKRSAWPGPVRGDRCRAVGLQRPGKETARLPEAAGTSLPRPGLRWAHRPGAPLDRRRRPRPARPGDRQLLARLAGHRGSVEAVDFSPDGKLLVTAGSDGAAWSGTCRPLQRQRLSAALPCPPPNCKPCGLVWVPPSRPNCSKPSTAWGRTPKPPWRSCASG